MTHRSKAMVEIAQANTPLCLKPEYEWLGPFNSVEHISADSQSIDFQIKRPTVQCCDLALTLALKVKNGGLDEIECISLTLGGLVVAGISHIALKQLFGDVDELSFTSAQKWLELPFFTRHPFYFGEITKYTSVTMTVRFFDIAKDRFDIARRRTLVVSSRLHLLRDHLSFASSAAQRYVASQHLLNYYTKSQVSSVVIPTDKPIDRKSDPLKTILQVTLRDFRTETLRCSDNLEILMPNATYPVRLYVTAYDSEGQPCAFEFDKVQLDHQDVQLTGDPHRNESYHFPPSIMTRLTILTSSTFHHLRITVEHDQVLNYFSGMMSLGPMAKLSS